MENDAVGTDRLLRCRSLSHSYIGFSLSRWQDYVDVQGPQHLAQDEEEYSEAQCLRTVSITLGEK